MLLKLPEIITSTKASEKELKGAKTATTGEQFDSLDERIDCEVDRLNKKVEVSMLQQEDAESHVVENTVDGMTTDMIVKGRTLRNLVIDGSLSKTIGISTQTQAKYGYSFLLKDNTEYTVVFKVEGKTDDNKVSISLNGGSSGRTYVVTNGTNKIKITTLTNNRGIWFYYTNDVLNGTGTVKDVMILENDWINKPIPQYFESIKSFGQQEDKISILSSSENLLNEKEILPTGIASTIPIEYSNGKLVFKTTGNKRSSSNFKVFLEKGKQYIIYKYNIVGDSNTVLGYLWLDNDIRVNYGSAFTFNRETGYYYIRPFSETTGGEVSLNLMMNEGTSLLPYEPYKCDKKDILLSQCGFHEGLRGLNNSVYDELNSVRNVAVKRIDKYTFTGDENWQPSSELQDELICFYMFFSQSTVLTPIICNNFIQKPTMEKGVECITNNGGGSSIIRIKILKSKLISQDVEGFKKWLKENPTTIYYELAEPIKTPLTEDINIKTFNERTYVNFENSISGTSSFKTPVDSAATIARLNRENRALEEENKNLRQDFESTTLTLTDSDLELVKQNVDMDFRLMEVEFALDIPQAILSSDIKFKNKKGEVKSMARTPYEMMKIVILSGDYDREDYMHKVGKYYERGRMTKEEHDELMSLMTADEVISK